MSKTLLIIDMQPLFKKSEKILKPVMALIKKAKANNWQIINVTFEADFLSAGENDECFPKIAQALMDYKKAVSLIKDDCDGGYEVSGCLKTKRIASKEVIVCGCYADQCVYETICTLRKLHPKLPITMMKKALQPCYKHPNYKREGIKVTEFKKLVTLLTP